MAHLPGIRLWRSLFVTHRSLTAVTMMFIACVAIALSTGFWLTWRLAYVALIGVPVAYAWSRLNLSGIEVIPDRHVDRLQEGGRFEERLTIRNRSWFGKIWLEVDDPSEMPWHSARRVVTVPARGSKTWRAESTVRRRGLYTVGPVEVSTGDPFGLFRHTRRFGRAQSVLVYPRAVELPNFNVPAANLPGEGRFRRRTHYVTPNASGVRPYEYGDSFNRIHWASTARTGELMVKLFELDPASDIWIVLDLERAVNVGEGDESTEEYGVRVAASVARYFLMANRTVGFLSVGRKFDAEDAERGLQQYTRILESLAMARAWGDVPLADLLANESRRFGRHTTVVVITPSTDEAWVEAMGVLQQRGVKLAAILLEPSTFGSTASSLGVFASLAAIDVFTYMVQRSDDLLAALGAAPPPAEAGHGGRGSEGTGHDA
ncbi:MAG: DUF58 domain-containing protein [Dehalococcoidia bacterium]|nr:DUF58 domain-containing protein [Dehalococcoidia bacterium]